MADINVRFMHPIDGRVVKVTLDSDMTAKEAINELLANQLIQPNNSGYQLAVKGGPVLFAETKFKDAGLTEESVVRVIPMTDAGYLGTVEPDAKVSRSKVRASVWTSLISTAVGVGGSLIASLISALASADVFRAPMAVVAAAVAVLVATAFTFILARRERGPSQVAKLRDELATAYLNALDRSAFNPRAKEAR